MTRKITETNSVNSSKCLGLQRVNQYTLIKEIGKGAYGGVFLSVFLAIEASTDPLKDDKQYAVKVIKKSIASRLH